jgi:hypothetical protein
MRRFLLRLPVFALAFNLAPGAMSHAAAATPTPPTVATLAGTYRYVGNWKRDQARIQASIDEAITSLGWLGRKIAASRLESHLNRPTRVVIAQAGDNLAVTMDDYEAVAPLDGAKRDEIAPNGRESKLSYRVTDDAILQFFVAEHAERESTYSLDGEGRLIMTVYMTSEKLASAITYEFVYEKVP